MLERAGAAHAGRSGAPTRWWRNFAGQWLQLRNLRTRSPIVMIVPDFDDNLRQAFRRETELFFDSIVREDRSVLDLLTGGLHASSTSGSPGTTGFRTSTAAISGV